MSGFVDASWGDDDSSIDIDEVELRLTLDSEGTVSGAADLSYAPTAQLMKLILSKYTLLTT